MVGETSKQEEGSAMVIGCGLLILGGAFNIIAGYGEMTAIIKPNPIFGFVYLISGFLSVGAGLVIAGRIKKILKEDNPTSNSDIKDSSIGLFYILIFFGGIISLVGFTEATSILGADPVSGFLFMMFGFLLLGCGIYLGNRISISWMEN